jgi:hypothetical protein
MGQERLYYNTKFLLLVTYTLARRDENKQENNT